MPSNPVFFSLFFFFLHQSCGFAALHLLVLLHPGHSRPPEEELQEDDPGGADPTGTHGRPQEQEQETTGGGGGR